MWYTLHENTDLATPALLFYKQRVIDNIDQMIRISGSPSRLRPHIKTHKCAEIVKLQMSKGISRFKCATIAEAEMLAQCGAADVLHAYPLIGPAMHRMGELSKRYPATKFSALVDNLSNAAVLEAFGSFNVFIDVDCGMHRTGIAPDKVQLLHDFIQSSDHLTYQGLHVYDGHLHDSSFSVRAEKAMMVWSLVQSLMENFNAEGEVVIGGSPTFPIYAEKTDAMLSPGTPVLWDKGYGESLEGLEMFVPAAVIASRVISIPSPGIYCLDAGHKAISAEHQQPPLILGLTNFEIYMHSEEHMAIRTDESLSLGQMLFLVPHHICPTVALYDTAMVVEDGRINTQWEIQSRTRKISV